MVEINLVQNGGFEAGIEGWDVDPGAGSLEATHEDEGADAGSTGCMSLVCDRPEGTDPEGPPGTVSQALAGDVMGELLGRQLSFGIRVAADAAGVLFAFISTDGGETRTYGTGNADSRGHGRPDGRNVVADEYETLTCERVTVEDDADQVVYGVEVRRTCHATLDNAVLVIGAASMLAESVIGPGLLKALVAPEAAAPRRRRASAPPKPEPKPEPPSRAGTSTASTSPEPTSATTRGAGAPPTRD